VRAEAAAQAATSPNTHRAYAATYRSFCTQFNASYGEASGDVSCRRLHLFGDDVRAEGERALATLGGRLAALPWSWSSRRECAALVLLPRGRLCAVVLPSVV
jgi:hypothetical protein